MPEPLFELATRDDIADLTEYFSRNRRIQIRNVLTPQTATTIRDILASRTPWGIAWQSGEKPQAIEHATIRQLNQNEHRARSEAVAKSANEGKYAFQFARYPLVDAYLGKWNEGGAHDLLLEYINAPDFLDFVRNVTSLPQLRKADAQATLFAPGDFLAQHDDSDISEGRRIAYVLNLASDEWKPEWGGYLNFLNDDGDIVAGWRPRFNTLNLFAVPQRHAVSYVTPFAPIGRFAITGWFRDR